MSASSNLWGPGDYPDDFVTIDDLTKMGRRAAFAGDHGAVDALVMHAGNRLLVKHALLDIAVQIDEEGAAANARANADLEKLKRAMNPARWTEAMSNAWHLAIPDVQKAFADLHAAAMATPLGEVQ